jgi:hypothetical protein
LFSVEGIIEVLVVLFLIIYLRDNIVFSVYYSKMFPEKRIKTSIPVKKESLALIKVVKSN